ncbi:hypothetical protein E4U43_008406 [Claviceps pusilla]|uniref:Uncharacterized protein n=1 Tax=Claviceps pusilla TaxID=123648 RepID=A0A9P7T0U0_9HYPO|nr:hypothetical protein E4U43_008406 [Claviceps pusilla]
MSLLNHLEGSYEILAASAHDASTCTRSILRVLVRPLATSHMFSELGIAGATPLSEVYVRSCPGYPGEIRLLHCVAGTKGGNAKADGCTAGEERNMESKEIKQMQEV